MLMEPKRWVQVGGDTSVPTGINPSMRNAPPVTGTAKPSERRRASSAPNLRPDGTRGVGG